jgi:hypothetical protein
MSSVTQRNATRNQSTADYNMSHVFIWDNHFQSGTYKNQSGSLINLATGMLVARAAGTYETATATFSALTAGQTMIIAGLTYTSTGATTAAQLASAFANLDAGATTGAGTATGTYSGTLANYSTGAATGNQVTFTATTTGGKTDLTATGTGTSPTWVYSQGGSSIGSGYIPVTSGNLADVVGVAKVESGPVALPDSESIVISVGVKGTVDGTLLQLPSGVTLSTVVGNKTLLDVLEAIGIHVDVTAVENTKFDN